jgi:rhodanese-related sulfurtransferase
MQQLTEFAINHWQLVTAFVVVLGLLCASLMMSPGGLRAQDAVTLINREGAFIIDVRPAAEYAAGHLIDAVSIPLAELAGAGDRLKKGKNRPMLVYCGGGTLAPRAVRELKRLGYERAYALKGGISAWRAENLPVTAG